MEHINLNDQVARKLGVRVVRGDFLPGTILPSETELAKEFGVSRPVIREGIRQLIGKGMVETRQKRGAMVRPESNWNRLDPGLLAWTKEGGRLRRYLMDLVEMRLIVETSAAALAAERADPEDIFNLRAALMEMTAAGADAALFLEADLVFHTALLTATHNVFVVSVLAAIETALCESVSITNRPTSDNASSIRLHAAVVDAIEAKDAEGARSAMTTLLRDAKSRLEAALEK